MMTESAKKRVLEGLLSAMRAEHEGFHFYSMAARNTEDPKGHDVFGQLADDERDHLLNAVNYYKKMADDADDDFVKAFFLQLSAWESGHYQALLDQQENLREAYWSLNGFSPF
jgi:rubrerythrin